VKNKVVVITGASSGIGKALASLFFKRGARLVLVARTESKLVELTSSINNLGGDAIYVLADVSNQLDCSNVIMQAVDKFGGIDILVNNAGISMRALFIDLNLTDFEKVMSINFYGTIYMTKYALKYILERKGSIAGISSIAGHKGLPARTAYSASKFAMTGFLEALRIENLKKGLHVLIASPGFTASSIRQNALNSSGENQKESPRDEKKMMSAEDAAECIVFAIIKRRNTLVLTFQGRLLVFLNKFFPNLVDRLVFKNLSKEKNSPF
jgi:short-subunit dehydrogenase